MKLIYNKNLEETVEVKTYTDLEDKTKYTVENVLIYNINARIDIRIESDNYTVKQSEKLLTNTSIVIECLKDSIIDYNDLRKYLIINTLPLWNSLSTIEQSQLKSYYVVPNDYVWDNTQTSIYKSLVDNATKCRESRIDKGRSYVSLFYINDVQKSMDFFIDTELLMNQYIKGKIPALEAFINDSAIGSFDYTTNGFSTKSYYDATVKEQLNYLLFR